MTPVHLPWAGNVCAWPVVPLRRHYDIRLGKMLQSESESALDRPTPYIKAGHVHWDGVRTMDLPTMFATPAEQRRFALQAGDLLICEGGDVGRACLVGTVPEGTIYQNHVHRIRSDGRHLGFLAYVMRAVHESGWLNAMTNSVTITGLSTDKLGAIPVPDAPADEQRRIVGFLDAEVGRLDGLTARKQAEIDVLVARRKRLVSRIVGEGIDTAASARDAGLAGLNRVPQHWQVKPLKWTGARVSVGIVIQPATYYTPDGEVPALRGLNIRPGRVSDEDLVFISHASNGQLRKSVLHVGDIVVVRTGQAGAAAIVPDWADGANCVDLLIVRQTNELVPRYLEYVVNSDFAVEQVRLNSVGSIQAHFNVEAMKQLVVPVPPRDEQERIVAWLDERVNVIDRLVGTLSDQINVIGRYRHALITAAVTGVRSPIHEADSVAA